MSKRSAWAKNVLTVYPRMKRGLKKGDEGEEDWFVRVVWGREKVLKDREGFVKVVQLLSLALGRERRGYRSPKVSRSYFLE